MRFGSTGMTRKGDGWLLFRPSVYLVRLKSREINFSCDKMHLVL